jgi:formylglycine-generating enzyme required for sulfatase activity
MPKPYNVFIVYARKDAEYLEELRGHLRPMERAGMLKIWCDREIDPGAKWEEAILRNMDTADIILLMVSAAYYDSSYIHEKELKYALMRHEKEEASVLPVIVRKCKFNADPIVSSLQVLPKDAKAVTSWNDRDDAWVDVVEGIEKVVTKLEVAISKMARQTEEKMAETLELESRENELAKRKAEMEEKERQVALELELREKELAKRKAEVENKEKQAELESKRQEQAAKNTAFFDYPLVEVQGGTFTIGSPADEKDRYDDECQHQVTVADFLIGKYPVTQKQWIEIMGSNPSHFKGCDNCPVENVSWLQVEEFIQKLNGKTGVTWRLPTEAEWEYAARGGRQSNGYVYAGGNDLNKVSWNNKNAGGKTHPVGGKASNELGLYDMSGNVWEWCEDWKKPYPGCTGKDYTGSVRVMRGGSWGNGPRYCRVADRSSDAPGYRGNFVGFRLARTN